MTAFYGQDLHWRRQYCGMFTLARGESPERDAVLDALRRGDYIGSKDGLDLPSSGEVPAGLLAQFARAHTRSQRLRGWAKRAKSWADGVGIGLPAAMKAQLRRIF